MGGAWSSLAGVFVNRSARGGLLFLSSKRSVFMRTKQMMGVALAVACAAGMAAPAWSQCNGFELTTSSGAVIVPGVTDIGNHSDDSVTPITLPFPVSIYGTTYTAARAGANGNLQFTTSLTTWTNT